MRSLGLSSVTQHINNTRHNIHIENLELIKNITSARELDMCQRIHTRDDFNNFSLFFGMDRFIEVNG